MSLFLGVECNECQREVCQAWVCPLPGKRIMCTVEGVLAAAMAVFKKVVRERSRGGCQWLISELKSAIYWHRQFSSAGRKIDCECVPAVWEEAKCLFFSLPYSPSISWEVYCWWSWFCFQDEKHGLSRFWCWFTVQGSQRFPNTDPCHLYGFCVSKSKSLTSCPLETFLPSTCLRCVLKSCRQGLALLDALSLPNVALPSEKKTTQVKKHCCFS